MSETPYTPFAGTVVHAPSPIRTLRRFTKPRHVAEIRERVFARFRGLEFLVFVDGSLIESQLFHGTREGFYAGALAARIAFTDGGWVEAPVPTAPAPQ